MKQRLSGRNTIVLWLAMLITLGLFALVGYYFTVWQPDQDRVRAHERAVAACDAAIQARRWDDALALCEAALVEAPTDPRARQLLADARSGRLNYYYQQGMARLNAGEAEKALTALELVFGDDPTYQQVAELRQQAIVALTPTATPSITPTPSPIATASDTPLPTSTETPIFTVTPTDTPTATGPETATVTRTPPPTRTPRPTSTATEIPQSRPAITCQASGAFSSFWNIHRDNLGCPISEVIISPITVEYFQNGYLVWIKRLDKILVLPRDKDWSQHSNQWSSAEDPFSCDEARQMGNPIMGFGKLWCTNGEVRSSLGRPTSVELPHESARQQLFAEGMIFEIAGGNTMIVFNNGSWIEY